MEYCINRNYYLSDDSTKSFGTGNLVIIVTKFF